MSILYCSHILRVATALLTRMEGVWGLSRTMQTVHRQTSYSATSRQARFTHSSTRATRRGLKWQPPLTIRARRSARQSCSNQARCSPQCKITRRTRDQRATQCCPSKAVSVSNSVAMVIRLRLLSLPCRLEWAFTSRRSSIWISSSDHSFASKMRDRLSK